MTELYQNNQPRNKWSRCDERLSYIILCSDFEVEVKNECDQLSKTLIPAALE